MKLAFWQHLTVLTVLGLGATNFSSAALAAQFEQQEIDQSRFIVLAAPGGDIGYKLLILEQINSNRPCWSETGSNPSNVDPLLLNFDFTGICNRLVDSNSFSVRTAGEDQALQYSLRIIKQGNDLVLVAASNTDRNALVEIGRTNGLPTGFSRIVLNPGWRLTRRAFNGRALGHVYLTYDQPIEVLVASSRRNVPLGNQLPTTIPNTPSDAGSADLDSTNSDSTETPNPSPDAATPDVTAPRPTDTNPADTSVIPVPSLPPAISTTPVPDRTTPAPLPPLGTTRPTTPPRTGTAPNLSTILPRPSATTNATTNQSATPTPAQPTQSSSAAQPGTSGANDTPILPPPPPVLTAPDSGSTSTSSTGSGSTSTGSTTSTSQTTSPQAPRTSSSASGRSTTSQPTGVPQVSNSGGAPLRPRSLRREEPPTSQTGQASSGTSRSNSSSSTRSTSSGTASNSATGGSSSGSSTTVAQADETYQVIVVADSAEAQDKVRQIVPDAFLTTINGQVVMQVGVFQDRQEADQLQQKLSLEGLSTAVISVR